MFSGTKQGIYTIGRKAMNRESRKRIADYHIHAFAHYAFNFIIGQQLRLMHIHSIGKLKRSPAIGIFFRFGKLEKGKIELIPEISIIISLYDNAGWHALPWPDFSDLLSISNNNAKTCQK